MSEAIPVDAEVLDDFGELLSNWGEQTAVLVEQKPTDADLGQTSPWTARATGEAAWAFNLLGEALTEDLASALRAVLFWATAGAVHAALTTLDPSGRLAVDLTGHLDKQGYVPFTFRKPACDSDSELPSDTPGPEGL